MTYIDQLAYLLPPHSQQMTSQLLQLSKQNKRCAIVIKNVYYEQLIVIYTTLGHNSSNFKSNWYLVRGWVKLREGLQTKITNTEY